MLPDTDPTDLHTPRVWRADGWTAQVLKNEDDDGWAVAMTRRGDPEPALVGPWTMGRDKKNPKPLDGPAFSTLVKTAMEVLRRHEQQLHAQLHKRVTVDGPSGPVTVLLDIVPDEEGATATLTALDRLGEELARVGVPPSFKLDAARAGAWVTQGYGKPS